MGRTILIIDDNNDICTIIKQYLELSDYHVDTYQNSVAALEHIFDKEYDLIILDIMMSDIDGIELCSIIRDKIQCPIIFLSAKALEEDKVNALLAGGDDYITKPFSLKELQTRVECHIRREERIKTTKKSVITSGHILLDRDAKEIFCKGNKLKLTKKEYGVIELFMVNPNIMFSKESIFEKVWGDESESYLETVTESIKNIRRKIKERDTDNVYIKTVYGMGYKWEVSNA